MPPLDPGSLTLVVIIALLALGVVGMSAAIAYTARAQRLPAAAAYEDIYERLGSTQSALKAKQDELREVEQKIHDRDRYAAEAAFLERKIEELNQQYTNLGAARAEIEEVKAEAAAVAAEKAKHEQDRNALREEVERMQAELDPARIERLRQEQEDLRREIDALNAQAGPLRAERDTALRALAEVGAQEARLAAIGNRITELEAAAQQRRDELAELDRTTAEAREAQGALLANLRGAEAALAAARASTDEQARKKEDLSAELVRLTAETRSLEALRDVLRKEIQGLGGRGGDASASSGPVSPEMRAELLKDLVTEPVSLKLPAHLRNATRSESDALHEVDRYLAASGLRFSRRTLRGFHTALKINDTAQITVLAGVSGTGKSLLPRRYAEAMGIHFLQIAVEPRWDSPQDLLGFYNYVEKTYRATELARLLAHLDPWGNADLRKDTPDRQGHMAIVLLDEMNLARVEYYFSEFLSRLEARPTWSPDLVKDKAKDAFIPVDIRGLDNPPMLFPAHNILFVGTMNDDESTQSLSDKVLDRGNVLQFPAPSDFAAPKQSQGTPAEVAQKFSEWRGWVKKPDEIGEAQQRLVADAIGKLAGIMQAFGRPFGHRLNQAIRAYVANYPHEGNADRDVRIPLADQVEFRILPKLRGIEIDTHREAFDRLETLVRDTLDDKDLAAKIASNREEQAASAGLFVWRGLSRAI